MAIKELFVVDIVGYREGSVAVFAVGVADGIFVVIITDGYIVDIGFAVLIVGDLEGFIVGLIVGIMVLFTISVRLLLLKSVYVGKLVGFNVLLYMALDSLTTAVEDEVSTDNDEGCVVDTKILEFLSLDMMIFAIQIIYVRATQEIFYFTNRFSPSQVTMINN